MDFSGMMSGGDPSMGGILSPDQQAIAQQYGLLSGAQAASQLAMPTRVPIGLGAVLGSVGAAMGQGRLQGGEQALKLKQLQQQTEGGAMANQLQKLTLGFYQDANNPQSQGGQPGMQQGPLSGIPMAPGKGPAMAAGMGGGGILSGSPQGAPQAPQGMPQGPLSGVPGAPSPAAQAGGIGSLDPSQLIATGQRLLRVPGMAAQGTSLIEQGTKMIDQGFSVGPGGIKQMAPGQAQFLAQTAGATKNAQNQSDLTFAPVIAAATDKAKAEVAMATQPALEAAKTAAVNAANAHKELTPAEKNTQEQKISTDFQTSEAYKRHYEATQAYKNVIEAAKGTDKASDIALVDSLVKMFNPQATVRQSTFENFMEHSQGLPDNVRGLVSAWYSNGQHLQPETRQQLMDQATNYMNSSRQIYSGVADFTRQQAAAQGLNPRNVVPDIIDPITAMEIAKQRGLIK